MGGGLTRELEESPLSNTGDLRSEVKENLSACLAPPSSVGDKMEVGDTMEVWSPPGRLRPVGGRVRPPGGAKSLLR